MWQEQIALGKLVNVYFDVASVPVYVSYEGFPCPAVKRYLKKTIDQIGANKIIWVAICR